jgi:hypothetical protein
MSNYYAALIHDSYHVEGDERSRTNPGHGYPAHTVDYISIMKFESKEKMIGWVKSNESSVYSKKKYEIILCTPVTVTVSLDIKVDVNG